MSYVLPSIYRGDTAPLWNFTPLFLDASGDPIAAPGTATDARMQIRELNFNGPIIGEYTVLDNTLDIIDATNWQFETVPRVLTTAYYGSAVWDVEITYTDPLDSISKVITIADGTLTIKADITR